MKRKNKKIERRELQIRAVVLSEAGYSNEEIAKTLGVSESMVNVLIKEKNDDQN